VKKAESFSLSYNGYTTVVVKDLADYFVLSEPTTNPIVEIMLSE
jgi:hypothetical protein